MVGDRNRMLSLVFRYRGGDCEQAGVNPFGLDW